MERARAILAIVLFVGAAACGSCGSSSSDGTPPQDAAPEGETAAPSGCAAGELLQDDGHCEPAGIPPSACGKGFEADGHRGCNAVLPADPCAAGQMAVPGETSCHEVSPCGAGAWGDIPVEASTQYVDASFGGASDGSSTAPWKKIQDGVKAAASGAIVAIAAGSYAEDVGIGSFGGKPVRLWGVCPAKVEIVGSAGALAAVSIRPSASGTEVHALAVRAGTIGIALSGSRDVVFEHVWVHDTGKRGIELVNSQGATSATIRSSLVEKSHDYGVFSRGSTLTIESSVVRDTQPGTTIETGPGRGIHAEDDVSGQRASLTVRACVVEGNHDVGVLVVASDATIEETLVRGTQPYSAGGPGGRGLSLQSDGANRGTLTMSASVLEKNQEVCMFIEGSDATLDTTVLRDTQPSAIDRTNGRGIDLQDKTGQSSTLTTHASVIERDYDLGLFVAGSQATLESTIVRDTSPMNADGTSGRGVSVQDHASVRAALTMRGCVVQRNYDIGVFGEGVDAILEGTAVLDTQPRASDGQAGRGINVQDDPLTHTASTAKLSTLLVDGSFECGITIVATDATIDSVVVRNTKARSADGLFGDGIAIIADLGAASATITASRFEASARAGLSSFGGAVQIRASTFECNPIHIDGEKLGTFDQTFTDLGGNGCGCGGASVQCQVLSSGLAPPLPIGPSP